MLVAPDAASALNRIEALRCTSCEMIGVACRTTATYEGAPVSAGLFTALGEVMACCDRPSDPLCDCIAHHELGRQYQGRWPGLLALGVEPVFCLRC
jgi:hypothetical protein